MCSRVPSSTGLTRNQRRLSGRSGWRDGLVLADRQYELYNLTNVRGKVHQRNTAFAD